MTNENNPMAAGYSAKKEHWQFLKIHGNQTSCRKKLSYPSNTTNEFYHLLKNYPELCCIKCAANWKEYVKHKLANKEKNQTS